MGDLVQDVHVGRFKISRHGIKISNVINGQYKNKNSGKNFENL